MDELTVRVVKEARDRGMDLCGVADATLANEKAPVGFTPEDQLPGAKAVVIFAQRLPSGSFLIPPENLLSEKYYMRSWWSCFRIMDETAYRLAQLLEKEGGYQSVQIPANEPMRIHDGKPRGMVSLKHMGQLAGIGSIAMNSLLVHPEHGNMLRLGGIITEAPLSSNTPMMEDPCPDNCKRCVEACPVNAIRDHALDIITCMKLSLRHPLMKPYRLTKFLLRISTRSKIIHRLLEDLINMMITQYSESCTRCLVTCRHFQISMKRAHKRLIVN